ncbi:glycoprotein [Wuhan Insect virus 7]|uniref:glycoprotein n=1 Tax=Wuhan Insect virus 7 TaxID=1608112 RepID=UPI0005AD42A1|nr:glycoprotein [Wuhan Insect virus 7]AJG39195.1 glycoprotein [Wuhan Insect virus 7]
MFPSIFCLMLLVMTSSVGQFILPIKEITPPRPINEHHLSCRLGPGALYPTTSSSVVVRSIHPDSNPVPIQGYLCSKKEYTLTCSENFLWMETVKKDSRSVPVTPSECVDAVNSWLQDKLDKDTQLTKDCGWMSTNTVKKEIFDIQGKHVRLNPYEMEYIDEILHRGKCSSKICQTKYADMLWVSEGDLNQTCPKMIGADVRMSLGDQKTPSSVILHSNYVPGVSLEGACRDFSFCGHRGMVLRTGHFVVVSSDFPSTIVKMYNLFQVCQKDLTIVSDNMNSEITSSKLDLMKIFLLDKCQQVVARIKGGLSVTRYDLGFLSPQISGVGSGYVASNRSVLVGQYKYMLVHSYVANCHSCRSCVINAVTDEGVIPVHLTPDQCPCANFNGCYLPNGIKVYKDKVYNPLLDIDEEFYHQMTEVELNPNYISHPKDVKETFLSLPATEEVEQHHGRTLDSVVGSLVPDFSFSIWPYFVGLGALVIIIIILWRRRSYKPPAEAPIRDFPVIYTPQSSFGPIAQIRWN